MGMFIIFALALHDNMQTPPDARARAVGNIPTVGAAC